MKKLMIAVFAGLFMMSLGSVSMAGMLDKLKGKSEEAKEETSEALESKKADTGEAIEAQDASTKESGGAMDKAKEKVKDAVDEKIDGLGK